LNCSKNDVGVVDGSHIVLFFDCSTNLGIPLGENVSLGSKEKLKRAFRGKKRTPSARWRSRIVFCFVG
jgi:hypothetical protein